MKSFVELVKFFFTIPFVRVFLSAKACQDPLEKFFGQQRQCGRVNENLNVMDFNKNTQALTVVHGICRDIKGNCRGSTSHTSVDSSLMEPLPKRRKNLTMRVCMLTVCVCVNCVHVCVLRLHLCYTYNFIIEIIYLFSHSYLSDTVIENLTNS